tara:strand:- start:4227 stop:4841 length:615 start_codon:yes stop_codon:yes gene_type:complete
MKRGQVYILAVIIIGFLLYTIITPINIMHKKVIDDDFEEISKNYELESSKLLNELINKQDIKTEEIKNDFLKFTVAFTSYSKTKNPNFGIIYAFPYRDSIMIGNYAFTDTDFVVDGNTESLAGCFEEVKTSISLFGLKLDVSGIDVDTYKDCISDPLPFSKGNILEFEIDGVEYSFEPSGDRSDIIVVSREELTDGVKVFISEQ